MGIVSTSIAPAAGIITGTQNATDAARSSQNSTTNVTQTINANPSAAVVTLSNDSKSRAASSGDKRAVDGTFEKQGSEGGSKSGVSKDKKEEKGAVVNVSA